MKDTLPIARTDSDKISKWRFASSSSSTETNGLFGGEKAKGDSFPARSQKVVIWREGSVTGSSIVAAVAAGLQASFEGPPQQQGEG